MAQDNEGNSAPKTSVSVEDLPLDIPPPPRVPTRPSWPFVIFGNVLVLVAVFVIWLNILPNWVIAVIGTCSPVAMLWVDDPRQRALTEWFTRERKAELKAHISDEEKLDTIITADIKSSIEFAPSIEKISMPMLFVTLLPIPSVFADVSSYFGDWVWIARWAIALIVSIVFYAAMLLLWTTANFTLAGETYDYEGLRKEQWDETPVQDLNDIHIIRQLVSLANLHRRIEAYTLESALLSALSFSSFLSIIVEKPDIQSELPKMGPHSFANTPLDVAVSLPLLGKVSKYPSLETGYITQHVMEYICFTLLMCAVTFLGVLVARLRFNEGYRDAESCLKTAERLNELEDRAIEKNDAASQEIYAREIDRMLKRAEKMESGLGLTVNHMRFSRDLGIFFFIATLALCGLFFNFAMGIIIAGIFFTLMILGFIDRVGRNFLRQNIFGHGGKLGEILSKGLR